MLTVQSQVLVLYDVDLLLPRLVLGWVRIAVNSKVTSALVSNDLTMNNNKSKVWSCILTLPSSAVNAI